MPTIRTRIEPEKEIEVSDAELTDLTRLGLVLETKASTPEGARRAAIAQRAATNDGQEG